MKKLTTKQRREIGALRKLADRRIDTAAIPSVTDWSKATRGRFYRAGISRRMPIYLDPELQSVLSRRAAHRRVDTSTLVNELLKKEIRLTKAG